MDIVYIRVPKTGSRSILNLLSGTKFYTFSYGGPNAFVTKYGIGSVCDFKKTKLFLSNDWFSFALVRNPFDRAVSSWTFSLKNKWISCTFEHFLRNIKSFSNIVSLCAAPQVQFITDDKNTLSCLSSIIKLESKEEINSLIKDVLGIKKNMPSLNISNSLRPHKDYKKMYSKETKCLIEEIYKEDLELFSYVF